VRACLLLFFVVMVDPVTRSVSWRVPVSS
jgi:hypothetical protein